MNDNINTPAETQGGPAGTQRENDELDIGNDLSIGSVSGEGVSDLDPEREVEETDEQENGSRGGAGDDQQSGDNGINPLPGEIDPQKKELNNDVDIENADEDELNPYPDESEPDVNDKVNSTWMMSGQNLVI